MTEFYLSINVLSRLVVVGLIAYVVYRRVHCGSSCSRLGIAATSWFGWFVGAVGVLGVVAPVFGAALAVALSLCLLDWNLEHEPKVSNRDNQTVSSGADGARTRSGDV